jgi:trimeric autotransporter adhesin
MSTKTTFKRIALVTVAALGFGLLSSVTPASAVASTALNAVVGPNGATSLTVVGGSNTTTGALIRLDVTSDSATSTDIGLQEGETITASVIGVPTSVTAKTLLANGGSVADTTSATGSGISDFTMVEVRGQTQGTVGTATSSTSGNTDWSKISTNNSAANMIANAESFTALATAVGFTTAMDGQLGGYGVAGTSSNTFFTNMDGRKETTATNNTVSYYVSVHPRTNAVVVDQGAYTFQFQLTDANGVVRGTKTVKIDFVSTAAKSDATVAVATSGNYLAAAALATSDSTGATYATLTLRNREGGLVRTNSGGAPVPSVRMQVSTTAVPVYTDTNTAGTTRLNVSDTGTLASDFGTSSQGVGTLVPSDGVYGISANNLPYLKSATGQAYRIESAYGNAPIQTTAITIYAASGAGTANAALTDVIATAVGASTRDTEVYSDLGATARNITVPTTTTTATLKFTIQSAAATAAGGALITVTPTWSGAIGTANVSPATSTTGTVYTTDALGNFSVTVTNSTPVDGAKITLELSGGASFGADTNTVSITFKDPVATTIAVADPVASVSVLSGSTNVTTVLVSDQFGNPVKNQVVTVSTTQTPAVVSTTVISPITTNADGLASFSFTPATATTSAVLSFNTAPTAVTATTHTYTYVATLPVVATLSAYHGYTWGTADVLTPATGIYSTASGTTKLVIEDARNISKALTVDGDVLNDEIALRFVGLTSAGVAATGASVTVTAGEGGHIVSPSTGKPVKSATYAVGASGTAVINVLATAPGAITFTATSGTVTATAAMWVANRLNSEVTTASNTTQTSGRFVTVTAAATGAANGSGVPVTVAVTDRYGNPVSGVALNVVASGVGSFMGGSITNSFTTDASGSYTFLANTVVSDGGVAKFTATTGTVGSFTSAAGYVGATEVDATLAAGNSSASTEITFTAGSSATDVAQAATDAAAEATDAANAATDAANAAAEAADAATAAAQDAADAVAALSTEVTELISALRKQITSLTNLVIKIQKKVKA